MAEASIFENGYDEVIAEAIAEIQDIYLADDLPWVLGASGGKDSTVSTLLVWQALASLPIEKRTKPVHIISTDTGVENPVIEQYLHGVHRQMKQAALDQDLPIFVNMLKPEPEHGFLVLLIGKGYAAPHRQYRWCTDRCKVRPGDTFIRNQLEESGKVVLVLGTRKSESQARRRSMEKFAKKNVRDRLAPSGANSQTLVYSPIEDWGVHDVWAYLLNSDGQGWGIKSHDLFAIYSGASGEKECPLMIDGGNAESCGSSRFGCWTCTVASKDKSLSALIDQYPDEYGWMKPMRDLRDELAVRPNHDQRDHLRANRIPTLYTNDPTQLTPGPYHQKAREHWLRRLLEVQVQVQTEGPDPNFELVTLEDLRLIRDLWLQHWREAEDTLPVIYEEVTGKPFPDPRYSLGGLKPEDFDLLKEVCAEVDSEDESHYRVLRNLLVVEDQHKFKRHGVMKDIEHVLKVYGFRDKEFALRVAQQKRFGNEACELAVERYRALPSSERRVEVLSSLTEQALEDILAREIRKLPDNHPARQPLMFEFEQIPRVEVERQLVERLGLQVVETKTATGQESETLPMFGTG